LDGRTSRKTDCAAAPFDGVSSIHHRRRGFLRVTAESGTLPAARTLLGRASGPPPAAARPVDRVEAWLALVDGLNFDVAKGRKVRRVII